MQDITVVTVIRRRLDMLWRCSASVERQDYCGDVSHLVIIDDCRQTLATLEDNPRLPAGMCNIYMLRRPEDKNGPNRLAYLRNLSAWQIMSPWMSFLNDDNEFEPSHRSSLYLTAHEDELDAVYSHDRIFNSDGTPFLEEYWPWTRTWEEAEGEYIFYCSVGVIIRGSNLQRHTIQREPDKPEVL